MTSIAVSAVRAKPSSTTARRKPRCSRQPRPVTCFPDVLACGTLTTGTDRLHDLFTGAAVLAVTTGDDTDSTTTLYWCQAIHDDGRVLGFELTKFGAGHKYSVVLDGDTFTCDCPDSTFRNRSCKHVAALHSALCHHGE
jgi:hypothetical protein